MRTTIRLVGPAILLVLLMAGLSVASAQQGSNGSGGRIPTSMSLTPVEEWSCIRDQQVFTASAMDAGDGVQGARVEFILNRFPAAVGDIVEVAGNGPSKVDNTFATVFTNAGGQASATLTATRPGDTDVTAFVPAIRDDSAHKAFGVMHWVDGCPWFPGDAENPIGDNHPMAVSVLRVSDGGPVEGVPVRWTVVDNDPDARFVGAEGDGNVIVAPTGASGASNVTLEQTSPLIGANSVLIEVLTEDGKTMFSHTAVKNWKSPILGLTASGPTTAGLLRNVPFDMVVSNTGDFLATETILTMALPAGLVFVSATPAATVAAAEGGSGQVVTWNLGEVAIGQSVPVSLTAQAVHTRLQSSAVKVVSAEGLSAQATLATNVIPGVLDVTKTGPSAAARGSEVIYTIQVVSSGPGANTQIKVIDTLPVGMSFVSADAQSTQEAGQVIFDVGTLDQGNRRTIELVLSADRPGVWVNTATATSAEGASDEDTATVLVVRPVLGVAKTGPESALINTDFSYSITVTNNGDGEATNVTLVDSLPAGLALVRTDPAAAVDGSTATWNVGDLAPGASATVSLTVEGVEAGEQENVVTASSGGGSTLSPEARATTTILVPDVSLETTGRSTLFVGNQAPYTLTATNTGDAPLTGVTITENIPAGLSYVSSDRAGVVSEDMRQVVWDVGSLEVDASTSVTVTLRGDVLGTVANSASVTSAEGASATADPPKVINVVPAPGASIAITDSADPLTEGEDVDYRVIVSNQGRSDITGIMVTVTIPDEMTYLGTDATTEDANGRTVVAVAGPASLAPGSEFAFVVSVRANSLPGDDDDNRKDVVTKATLIYTEFSLPVSTEEGTTILGL